MGSGRLPPDITGDLEAIKRALIEMAATDLPPEKTQAMAAEISAIRLQLQRLAADQLAVSEEIARRIASHL
jgi:hypothetical protein